MSVMATLVQKATDVASSAVNAVSGKSNVSTSTKSVVDYSAQNEAKDLLVKGIIRNPLMKDLPAELEDLSKHVTFEGNPLPSIPINWRFAESIAASAEGGSG